MNVGFFFQEINYANPIKRQSRRCLIDNQQQLCIFYQKMLEIICISSKVALGGKNKVDIKAQALFLSSISAYILQFKHRCSWKMNKGVNSVVITRFIRRIFSRIIATDIQTSVRQISRSYLQDIRKVFKFILIFLKILF